MNDYQKARLKEFCDFYGWPEDQTAQLFECSKAFFECVWRGMNPATRREEIDYYNGPWLTLRQMSYDEPDTFPSEAKKLIDELPEGSTVFEFGCGVGDGLIYAAQKGMKVYGTEVLCKIPFIRHRLEIRGLNDVSLGFDFDDIGDIKPDLSLFISSLDHVPDPVGVAKLVCSKTLGKVFATPCIDETYDRPTHNKNILLYVPEAFRVIDEHNKRAPKIS